MVHMDEKDKKIQEQMKAEGKIKISNFNEMVKNHFKSKYNVDGYFEFLYVEYEYFDKNHQIYSLDLGQYVSGPENRKVKAVMPFFLEPNSINDVRRFSLEIPGIIDINNLTSEILSKSPNGVRFITDNEIKEILFNEGYEEPFFDHYFYSMMDYPDYNLYARPILKDKKLWDGATDSIINDLLKNEYIFFGKHPTDMSIFAGSIVDTDVAKQLEQAYLNGELEHDKIIDTENFPQNSPDMSTCQILDILFSENRLPFRQVSYCITEFPDGSARVTDFYKEYSYEDRKFIRVLATQNQNGDITLSNNDAIRKDNYYWVEVKPIDIEKGKKR